MFSYGRPGTRANLGAVFERVVVGGCLRRQVAKGKWTDGREEMVVSPSTECLGWENKDETSDRITRGVEGPVCWQWTVVGTGGLEEERVMNGEWCSAGAVQTAGERRRGSVVSLSGLFGGVARARERNEVLERRNIGIMEFPMNSESNAGHQRTMTMNQRTLEMQS